MNESIKEDSVNESYLHGGTDVNDIGRENYITVGEMIGRQEDYITVGETRGRQEVYDNFPREINIKPLSSGYLVNVGCQSVAVETTEKLIKAISEYLTNPVDYESKWNKNTNRNKL